MEWCATQHVEPVHSWMLTLTYAPEHIPVTPDGHETLRRRQVIKWIRAMHRKSPLRWYVVGEYGEQSGRPHYHLAVFGLGFAAKDHLRAQWPYGHTSWSAMDLKRAAYCAQYTTKKLTAHTDERLSEGMEPEFRASTRVPPLGSAFVDSLVHRYRSGPGRKVLLERGDVERSFRINGRIYPLDEWSLARLRKQLGIPLLHVERADRHPAYLDWHETQEAEWEPEINNAITVKFDAKKKALKARRRSI